MWFHVVLGDRMCFEQVCHSQDVQRFVGLMTWGLLSIWRLKKQLEARNVPVFMVEATVGQSFADLTRIGLGRAKGMVTFCTSEYGAYTGVGYETFHELEFAHDHRLPLFPIRLCEQWPPAPQNNERGIYQNQLVFKNGLVYIDDRQMNKAQHVADQIAESVARMGIFRTKLQL